MTANAATAVAPARPPVKGATGSAAPPPPGLAGAHFGAALVFFLAGAGGLVLVAPDLAQGAFFLPRVISVVHLFTLGWLVLSIFGALGQFLPVAVGKPLRSTPMAHLSLGAQVLGASSFIVGLLTARPALVHLGAGALALAFVVFSANLAMTLSPVKERDVTWYSLAAASLFLIVTPVYGVMLALNLHGAGLFADRFAVVAAHAHIALVGVVLLVMVGVAHRLLPMFLLSHGASERPAWVALVLFSACASLLSVPIGHPARFVVAGACALGGVIAFVAQSLLFFRHRKRRAVDPGMRLALSGVIGLVAAALLAPFALARGLADLRLLVTYFVVLLGALSSFVAGHYYKIVPFLVWNHRFGPLVGKRKVPTVAELYSQPAASLSGWLLVAGWVGVAAGTYAGSPSLAQSFAVLFAAGALVEGIVIARVSRRRLT